MSWYCIQTRQKQEKRAKENIERQNFNVFFPTFIEQTIRRGETQQRIQALFPSYLFVEFNPDDDRWYSLVSTYGVKRIFSVIPVTKDRDYSYIKPIPVPMTVINSLRNQLIPSPTPNRQLISPGTRLRVIKGPFKGNEGVCHLASAKRVSLLMQAMNGEIEMQFTTDSVEPVLS